MSTNWKGWDNPEDAFKELDKEQYVGIAKGLGAYRQALMVNGFTRREALRLVEGYSKFIYDLSIEDFLAKKRLEEEEEFDREFEEEDEDGDVDSSGEIE